MQEMDMRVGDFWGWNNDLVLVFVGKASYARPDSVFASEVRQGLTCPNLLDEANVSDFSFEPSCFQGISVVRGLAFESLIPQEPRYVFKVTIAGQDSAPHQYRWLFASEVAREMKPRLKPLPGGERQGIPTWTSDIMGLRRSHTIIDDPVSIPSDDRLERLRFWRDANPPMPNEGEGAHVVMSSVFRDTPFTGSPSLTIGIGSSRCQKCSFHSGAPQLRCAPFPQGDPEECPHYELKQ